MDFIMDNYIWFILGGIIIIMAIIGYIADKTNFGRDKIEQAPKIKKEKVKKNNQPEKIEIEDKGIGDLTQSLSETNKDEENQVNVSEDLYAPLGEEPTTVEDSMDFVDQDLYKPLPDKVEAVMSDTNDTTLEPTEDIVPEETVDSNEIVNDTVEPVVINEPNEPVVINEPNEPVSSEEDIWKF